MRWEKFKKKVKKAIIGKKTGESEKNLEPEKMSRIRKVTLGPDPQIPLSVGDTRQFEITLLDDLGQKISLSALPEEFRPTLKNVSVNPSHARIMSVDRENLTFTLHCLGPVQTPVNISLSPGRKGHHDLPERFTIFIDQKLEKKGEYKYVCVRFFIVDKCGGRSEDGSTKEGLLKGAKYTDKNFGELSEEAVNLIENLIGEASEIWEQCRIKIVPCLDENGKPRFYAFDPEGFPAKKTKAGKIKKKMIFCNIKVAEEVDLCQFYTDRKMETCRGAKKGKTTILKVKWAKQREGFQKHCGQEDAEISKEDLIKLLEKAIEDINTEIEETASRSRREMLISHKKDHENLLKGITNPPEEDIDVLSVFGIAVDGKFKERCLNVFVFKEFIDTSAEFDKAGIAQKPGRVIFLDESVVTSEGDGKVFAHEIGHNLSLGHHGDSENVMHEEIKEGNLDDGQCKKVREHLSQKKNKKKLASEKEKKG